MNKLVCTTLEGKVFVYDLRTYHPTEGYNSLNKKISDSTIWGAKHSFHNRDIFATMGGDGVSKIFKYNYPSKRWIDDGDGRKKGVMGEIELLNDKKIAE